MTPAAALAAMALSAAQPDPDASPPPAPSGAQPAPPTIDSLLDQPPISEDARAAAVRAAFDAAQARRGDLDGSWRLSTRDGEALYILQLSDPGQVPDPRSSTPKVPVIEGAWRDPTRDHQAGASGFLSSVQRDGDRLTLSFELAPGARRGRVLALHRSPSGEWTGELDIDGAARPVIMRRF